MHSSSPAKSGKPCIWESAKKMTRSRSSSKTFRIKPKSMSFLSKAKLTSNKKFVPPFRSSEYYSIKYLGVTKGEMGVLSKRSKLPQLSPLETCKDVPLYVINNCLGSMNKEDSVKRIQSKSRDNSPTRKKGKIEDDGFVVHKYARPRGLTASRKSINKQNTLVDTSATPIQTRSVSGWKLKQRKSISPSKVKQQEGKIKNGIFLKLFSKASEKTGYAEPYLKYIVSSRAQPIN